MAKKTLIITQKQLDEINSSAGLFDYLDGMAKNPDMSGNEYADEVSSDGGNNVNSTYPETPMTGDEYEDDMANTSYLFGYGMGFGRNGMHVPHNLFEVSKKKDWEEKNILNEVDQNGWKDLEGQNFSYDDNDVLSANAVKQRRYRERVAAKKAVKGATPEEKLKGLQSYARMQNSSNNANYKKAYKKLDNVLNARRLKPKQLTSAPKESGNGMAHSKKTDNGFITPAN